MREIANMFWKPKCHYKYISKVEFACEILLAFVRPIQDQHFHKRVGTFVAVRDINLHVL